MQLHFTHSPLGAGQKCRLYEETRQTLFDGTCRFMGSMAMGPLEGDTQNPQFSLAALDFTPFHCGQWTEMLCMRPYWQKLTSPNPG